MINNIKPFLISIVLFPLLSCSLFIGSDGKYGNTFLAIDWVEEPIYYFDTNPEIPSNFQRSYYYKIESGVYEFEYAYADGFGWRGTYTIRESEPGESGSLFFNDGADGRDTHYSMILTYNGIILDKEHKVITSNKNKNELIITATISNKYTLVIDMYSFQTVKEYLND